MISSLAIQDGIEEFCRCPLDLVQPEAISNPVSSGSGLLLVLEYYGYAIEFEPVLHRLFTGLTTRRVLI
jgi:hypothetical protein